MFSNGFDLNNIVISGDIVRLFRARWKVAIMSVAANGRSIPALHRVIGAYDGGRALLNPRARVWIDFRNLTVPTDLRFLIARGALSDPLAWKQNKYEKKYMVRHWNTIRKI